MFRISRLCSLPFVLTINSLLPSGLTISPSIVSSVFSNLNFVLMTIQLCFPGDTLFFIWSYPILEKLRVHQSCGNGSISFLRCFFVEVLLESIYNFKFVEKIGG